MVMPLYDDNPFKLKRPPVMTWTLIVLNIVVFMFEFGSESPRVFVSHYAVVPAAVTGSTVVPGALSPMLTLFSYMFLHSDFLHILGNLIFLWVFGDNVEQALGRLRFLAFYLAVGALAGLAYVVSTPSSRIPLIGASGAIAGVVIAYAMLRPCAKITALVIGIPMRISAYWIIGIFVFIQFINLGAASQSDVAWWCHIGGMAAGAVLVPFMRLPGVPLFECLQPEQAPPEVVQAMPETSHLPGARPGPWQR
jgi:membrane associated rhomboid family serine protease